MDPKKILLTLFFVCLMIPAYQVNAFTYAQNRVVKSEYVVYETKPSVFMFPREFYENRYIRMQLNSNASGNIQISGIIIAWNHSALSSISFTIYRMNTSTTAVFVGTTGNFYTESLRSDLHYDNITFPTPIVINADSCYNKQFIISIDAPHEGMYFGYNINNTYKTAAIAQIIGGIVTNNTEQSMHMLIAPKYVSIESDIMYNLIMPFSYSFSQTFDSSASRIDYVKSRVYNNIFIQKNYSGQPQIIWWKEYPTTYVTRRLGGSHYNNSQYYFYSSSAYPSFLGGGVSVQNLYEYYPPVYYKDFITNVVRTGVLYYEQANASVFNNIIYFAEKFEHEYIEYYIIDSDLSAFAILPYLFVFIIGGFVSFYLSKKEEMTGLDSIRFFLVILNVALVNTSEVFYILSFVNIVISIIVWRKNKNE